VTDQFVAEIRVFGFNFAPNGWAFCDGQILPISQNTALFSLLGTTYGGNGQSTFALPDLRGSVPLHVGYNQPGPGLSTYDLGQMGGTDTVTLLSSEMPAHNHALRAGQDLADVNEVTPGQSSFAPSTDGLLYHTTQNVNLAFQATAVAGGSQPHNNLMPYLTLTFCIALQGIFPPRS
jgi:microcystin-dependent protein